MEKVLATGVTMCILAWALIAARLTPLLRNIISLIVIGLAAVMFLAVGEWVLNGVLFSVVAGASLLAERFPKSVQAHMRRRLDVTFMQDFFFFVGCIMLFFEIYELFVLETVTR
ncbi:MAG: hypothetical protein K2K46_02690 [Lachnospiraceae bacterium]|nr:hypothetical protein [Lachnospiraceae bacterium]